MNDRTRRRHRHDESPSVDDELNIVPFLDIVINLIINLIMFLLMVTSTGVSTQVAVSLPGACTRCPGSFEPTLGLNVVVADEGIWVTTRRGTMAPGCESLSVLAPGDTAVTIPKRGDAYDWTALTECVARVKTLAEREGLRFQRDEGEGEITVSADPLVEYQDLLSAMDAVRKRADESLFPHVMLAAGVR